MHIPPHPFHTIMLIKEEERVTRVFRDRLLVGTNEKRHPNASIQEPGVTQMEYGKEEAAKGASNAGKHPESTKGMLLRSRGWGIEKTERLGTSRLHQQCCLEAKGRLGCLRSENG
jgi:hypothetical protein